jgi:hypothetical protein
LAVAAEAAVSDGEFLDLVPCLEDGLAAAVVDVGGGQVAEEAARASSSVSVTSPARMVVQSFQATM